MSGWVDGLHAFDVEGNAELSLPGPDGSGEGVLSGGGLGAGRHGIGPDFGFGYLVADAPVRGRWTITPQPGSAVSGIATATPLPKLTVKGRYRGHGRCTTVRRPRLIAQSSRAHAGPDRVQWRASQEGSAGWTFTAMRRSP